MGRTPVSMDDLVAKSRRFVSALDGTIVCSFIAQLNCASTAGESASCIFVVVSGAVSAHARSADDHPTPSNVPATEPPPVRYRSQTTSQIETPGRLRRTSVGLSKKQVKEKRKLFSSWNPEEAEKAMEAAAAVEV